MVSNFLQLATTPILKILKIQWLPLRTYVDF